MLDAVGYGKEREYVLVAESYVQKEAERKREVERIVTNCRYLCGNIACRLK